MNPLEFLRSKVDEDPYEFLGEVQKIIQIMGVMGEESANFILLSVEGGSSHMVPAVKG